MGFGQFSSVDDFTVTVSVPKLIEKLKTNRIAHSKIVAEARAGYVKRATEALADKMQQLKEGKIASLFFALKVPVDNTPVYDMTISMLEMHTGEELMLNGVQYRNFVLDKWDWKDEFLATNSRYSVTAASMRDDIPAESSDVNW